MRSFVGCLLRLSEGRKKSMGDCVQLLETGHISSRSNFNICFSVGICERRILKNHGTASSIDERK